MKVNDIITIEEFIKNRKKYIIAKKKVRLSPPPILILNFYKNCVLNVKIL